MLEPARIPTVKVRNSILMWGALCAVCYIVFLMIMKMAGLLNVTGLRAVNYIILFLVCFFGIRKWVFKTEHYVPFLTVFITSLFTGLVSFALFCIFLILYSQYDTELTNLFRESAPTGFRAVPSTVVIFEGAAVSLVVAFINMQYFRRYEEGEVSPPHKSTTNTPH
jgi:hypothetical protein